jgi:hypothetical protein
MSPTKIKMAKEEKKRIRELKKTQRKELEKMRDSQNAAIKQVRRDATPTFFLMPIFKKIARGEVWLACPLSRSNHTREIGESGNEGGQVPNIGGIYPTTRVVGWIRAPRATTTRAIDADASPRLASNRPRRLQIPLQIPRLFGFRGFLVFLRLFFSFTFFPPTPTPPPFLPRRRRLNTIEPTPPHPYFRPPLANAQDSSSGKWKFLMAQTEVFSHFLAGTKKVEAGKKKGRRGKQAEDAEDAELVEQAEVGRVYSC